MFANLGMRAKGIRLKNTLKTQVNGLKFINRTYLFSSFFCIRVGGKLLKFSIIYVKTVVCGVEVHQIPSAVVLLAGSAQSQGRSGGLKVELRWTSLPRAAVFVRAGTTGKPAPFGTQQISKSKKNSPSLLSRTQPGIFQWGFGLHFSLLPLTNLLEFIPARVPYSVGFSQNIQVDDLKLAWVDYLPLLICTSEFEKNKDDLMPNFKK